MRNFPERNDTKPVSGETSDWWREIILSGHTYGRLLINQVKVSVQTDKSDSERKIAPVCVKVFAGHLTSRLPLSILTASLLCLASVTGFAGEGVEAADDPEARPAPRIEEMATGGEEQPVPKAKPTLKRVGQLSDEDLVIFTPEARARIRQTQEIEAVKARRTRGFVVRGQVIEIDDEGEVVRAGSGDRGLIVLEEYTAFPSEALIAQELLSDELLLHSPEGRARFLKELHLNPLDYNLLNRWELPWFWGTSAEERARMLEEQARFEAFKERTDKMLSSLKETNPEAYRDLKKLLDDRRHQRTANRE